ncbi:acyl-CoA dehydrogenase family protein [Salinibacterium sp. ZJ70]|uniref:acyl-CoA dehydrogenase family protein n=1 Tax=Salinibacterium sp. ZJ70 TaxID=2708084 RepID=UPI001422A85E|nr:acyl-CoA dehydrogenase family protein [Salinibacterium sp. ZJ70]
MRFLSTDEQLAIVDAVDDIISANGGARVARAWVDGDTAPGLALWAQLAEAGLMGLRVDEALGGFGGSTSDLVVVAERLGWHSVPGPMLESIALLPHLVDDEDRAGLADGTLIGTATVAGIAPLALDAHVANRHYAIAESHVAAADPGGAIASIDPARRLFPLTATGSPRDVDPAVIASAVDETTLACAAGLVGTGERLLAESVEYAKVREQFGAPVGQYQSLKHQLADVRVALSFARPLVWGAALSAGTSKHSRDVSAAKVAAGAAARLAAQTALQVHGAIGYTREHDVSIWLARAVAHDQAWGTQEHHRDRIARSLLAS